MDILIVDDSIAFDGYSPASQPLGGIEKACASLPGALRRRGHEVRVINRCRFAIQADGVKWQPWMAPRPVSCDVLIAHRKPELLDFPVSARRRVLWLASSARPLARGENAAILERHAEAPLVFYGAAHRATCPDGLARRAVTVAPGVRDDYRQAEPMAPAHPPRAIATVHPLRGLDWLLELWAAQIRPRAPEAELHVFSALLDRGALGSEAPDAVRPVLDRAMALREAGVVIQRPRSDPDMAEAYRAARAHLHPGSEGEVYCSTLAESQAVGLPGVVRDLPAAAERIRTSETGFVAPDDEAFASCAMLLLTNDDVFRGRSSEARASQRKRSWEDAAADFEALFS